jgi:Tol biopolymer transport system component
MSSSCRIAVIVLSVAALQRAASAGEKGIGTFRVNVDANGAEADGESNAGRIAISADGRFVAFDSYADNLVANDTNASLDVFVHDRMTGITERVSVDSAGVEGDGNSFFPAISSDGRVVSFHSKATNLVAGDTNGKEEVFVHDRVSGVTERMNVDSAGVQGNGGAYKSAINADGRFVSFYSYSRNLVASDVNAMPDVFLRDRVAGTTELISVDSNGVQADNGSFKSAISADGRFVAFDSFASNLVAGDTNTWSDVFVRDRQNGTTERVSVRSSGKQANGGSNRPAISADGRFVAFSSFATNLVTTDTNGTWDVFVHDRQTGVTEIVSVDGAGNVGDGSSIKPTISADGRYVAFSSEATNLVAGDTNGTQDVFVHDRLTGTTKRMSVDSGGAEADAACDKAVISADGRFVALGTSADNLVANDTNGHSDVFVHGPYLTLEADPNPAAAGVTLTLSTFTGDPNNLVMLVIDDVNGAPMFVPIVITTFDAQGNFAVGGTVPAGFSGNEIGFIAFGIVATGKVGVSNQVPVAFQ